MTFRFETTRRGMLLSAMAFGGLAACSKPQDNPAPASAGLTASWPLGIQLWTVNAELDKDIPGTLKAIKDLGFELIETAGVRGASPAEYRKQIEDAGLKIRSAHTNMSKLIDGFDKEIADAVALGAEWLVASSPKPGANFDPKKDWVVAMTESMNADQWKFNADHINKMAPKVKAAGLKFAYHNHPMEFKDLGGGQTGEDILVSAAPADQLRLELDIGWVAVGGADPAATIRKYADRVDLLHIKDMIQDPAEASGWRSVEVGAGVVKWAEVFAAAKEVGVKAWFVEQEAPYKKPILTSLAESVTHLRKL
ncbi:hypothetical protein ABAC460_01000 [Asticcacaulis sp. AC460]|uniref:sugar phosphate isomerase/epimerase family protein n=1 Tax=Asticcacaulis sp. AC460 TaxID=1282360 RepID=UPI0003C3D0D6|nr:sugar phosphate isomerase/epimerase [Asticcacaulis sp. AC460]ESQ93311.1 hypothetical protein ABAC460_01000 [Asticcacaulis sp. AC460]